MKTTFRSLNNHCQKILVLFALIFLTVPSIVSAQNLLLNGDFENTSSVRCDSNKSDAAFTSVMDNVTAFGGSLSELDIYTSGCFSADPQSGDKKIAFRADDVGTCNIAFDLSEPIVSGNTYNLSFWFNPSSEFGAAQGEIIIGLSNDNMSFGTEVFRGGGDVPVSSDSWTQIAGEFTAPSNANFLTIAAGGSSSSVWAHLDNFSLAKKGDVIPTMSQWALMILGLILTSLAVVRIRRVAVA